MFFFSYAFIKFVLSVHILRNIITAVHIVWLLRKLKCIIFFLGGTQFQVLKNPQSVYIPCPSKLSETQKKTRLGDLGVPHPFGRYFSWFETILDHIWTLWTSQSVWTRLSRPDYLDPFLWTCLLEPIYLVMSIWDCLFGTVHLTPSIWTHLFGPVYLDPSIGTWMFEPVYLDPSIWIRLFRPM